MNDFKLLRGDSQGRGRAPVHESRLSTQEGRSASGLIRLSDLVDHQNAQGDKNEDEVTMTARSGGSIDLPSARKKMNNFEAMKMLTNQMKNNTSSIMTSVVGSPAHQTPTPGKHALNEELTDRAFSDIREENSPGQGDKEGTRVEAIRNKNMHGQQLHSQFANITNKNATSDL